MMFTSNVMRDYYRSVLYSHSLHSCSQNNLRVPVGVKGWGIKLSGRFNQRRSVLVDTFAIAANCSNVIAFINTSI
ncbi:hypothetical protein AB71_2930 [Escherichia coli 1-182-04_S1_C3]|nr:hypothetical protein AB71_2930 [Escherichia coli 1-182-04_S1_C3]EZK29748.1 hypothetical protein AB12_2716 [Escherichia coli 1-182-04_S1_C1]KDA67819.1 hypothetical protein AB40_2751 [Escherichia coli 1-182-04_S1_C2]